MLDQKQQEILAQFGNAEVSFESYYKGDVRFGGIYQDESGFYRIETFLDKELVYRMYFSSTDKFRLGNYKWSWIKITKITYSPVVEIENGYMNWS